MGRHTDAGQARIDDIHDERLIRARVDLWHVSKAQGPGATPIPEMMAREIASWWQSPGWDGYPFAVYASTGKIIDDFADAYRRTYDKADFANRRFLSAMWARIQADMDPRGDPEW